MLRIVDHGTWQLTAADEDLHPAGPERLWNESYYFDFAAPDGSVGGYVRLGLYPNWDRAWYWACVVRPGRPAVLVADNAVPLPAHGSTAVRTAAIGATPADHGAAARGQGHARRDSCLAARAGRRIRRPRRRRARPPGYGPGLDHRRRCLPVQGPPPLRDPVPGDRDNPGRRRRGRGVGLGRARSQLGRARLVAGLLAVVLRSPRRRYCVSRYAGQHRLRHRLAVLRDAAPAARSAT